MGAILQIYLFGGVVTSWTQPSGDEVLFVRPDAKFDRSKPISGGIPHCFPQVRSLRSHWSDAGTAAVALHSFLPSLATCPMPLFSCLMNLQSLRLPNTWLPKFSVNCLGKHCAHCMHRRLSF